MENTINDKSLFDKKAFGNELKKTNTKLSKKLLLKNLVSIAKAPLNGMKK